MTSIEKIIQHQVNPFGNINFKPGNFWGEKQDLSNSVDSIHQEVITEVEELLDLVIKDNRSRSLVLLGDSGSGKSYLLGRLKRILNSKAFFAYIGPWADSDYIWRHVLRSTVDSLIQTPEGQQESQLMLWLKNLSAFTKSNNNIWQFLQSDRRKFIQHLKRTYKTAGLFNPDFFFGVLHDLTDPELYPIACEWLRGDDLSEESMEALKVSRCIDSEDAAKYILANFGRISTQTQPIVLCFDNLDNIPRLSDGSQDFQSLFNVNTTIHNSYLKNFLVIISVITDTLKKNLKHIQQADKYRIDKTLKLKQINLEQVEALWAYQLKPLHQQANPQPTSAIFPLNKQLLAESFPGGKALPRRTLTIAKDKYHEYKLRLIKGDPLPPSPPPGDIPPIEPEDTKAEEFELLWQKEYKKIQEKTKKITLLSAPDLIGMLKEALEALEIQGIKPKLITGKYAGYSLSYQQPGKRDRIGIVWTEDSNMTSFFNIMNASMKAIQKQLCNKLYLIRIGSVGNGKLKGYQLYQQIFRGTENIHIKPNITSVHQLATYHSLVNAAEAQELIVSGKVIKLQELQKLIREFQILNQCTLLQDLGVIPKQEKTPGTNGKRDWRAVKDFLFNVIKIQGYMGVPVLTSNCMDEFSDVSESDVTLLIQSLCEERKVKLTNPKAKLQDQLIYLIT